MNERSLIMSTDPVDDRPLDSLTFGQLEKTPEACAATAEYVRRILHSAGVRVAEDIALLGDTGLAGYGGFTERSGEMVEMIKLVRDGLAGCGVGLTCYVPLDRYCLVHNGSGSLQEGQEPRHAAFVDKISRELTSAEAGKVAAVEHIRRQTGGQSAGSAMQTIRDMARKTADAADTDLVPLPAPRGEWACDEHAVTFWPCRFCVAAEIARGPLGPYYTMTTSPDPDLDAVTDPVNPYEIDDRLKALNADGARGVDLYIRIARWSYKLARD